MSILKLAVQCSPDPRCPWRKQEILHSTYPGRPMRFHRVIYAMDKAPAKTARRQANYQPSSWDDYYIQSLPNATKGVQEDTPRISLLMDGVKKLLHAKKGTRDQLELIDVLQQLGMAYHFKNDINDALRIFHRTVTAEGTSSPLKKDDLCSMSLLFRLLREHSFVISEDIFACFKDEKGCWVDMNLHKTETVLSLYEASHLAKEGEFALEKAREVTTKHLRALLQGSTLETHQTESVRHALDLPINWRIPRLHTRWFIEAYQKRPNMDPLLLELAVLDFNMVQRLYIKELKVLSRWWNDLGMGQKLPFFRDRIVENFYWAVGAAFEPQFSSYRSALTKVNCFITVIDDVYDVYGTLDELELFTDAVERWEIDAVKQLPDYMKVCFLGLLNMNNDIAYEIMKKNGLNVIPQLKTAWSDLCKRYLVESKWYHRGYTPKFEEYLDNGWITIGCHIALTAACCTSEDVSQIDLEKFANNYQDMLQNSLVIIRLCNDLGTSTDELARGDVPKFVQCYMREKNVPEDKAREDVKELIRANWRSLNGDRVFNFASQKRMRDVAINLARTAHCVYQHGDGYGKPDREAKERVIALLMEPISLYEMLIK